MTLMRKSAKGGAPPADSQAPPDPPAKAKRARSSVQLPEKRRRKAAADDAFRVVEAVLAQHAPPLLPTPQSLFGMLCDVFELEFPGRLPQPAVEQLRQAL